MLVQDAHAAMTPYLRGKTPLPRPDDIARLTSLTPNAYLTRRPGSPKPKRDHRAQRMAKQVTGWMAALPTSTGSLRFRRPIHDAGDWSVDLSGTAVKLE